MRCTTLLAAGLAVLAIALTACGDPDRVTAKNPRDKPCPPPPEPEYQSVVLGTIGKYHLVESRYPITRVGDVLAAFKPDLVLLGIRVDAFREGRLEDASFEMTYAASFAKTRGIPIEPVDWRADAETPAGTGAAARPEVEPADAVEIARREADVLARPPLYTFEQANGRELEERVFLATAAETRHRAGNGPASRRRGWLEQLTVDAVVRHGRPKRILAVVDVFDRPAIDLAVRLAGYDARDPVAIATAAKEVAPPELPSEVLAQYREQLARARSHAASGGAASKAAWEERAKVLDLVVEKRGTCCVTQSALGNAPERR
jgi:hypothetical protein